MNVESMHLKQGTWPDILSPDLRRQLLLDKITRAQFALEQRKKCINGKLLGEFEGTTTYEQCQ